MKIQKIEIRRFKSINEIKLPETKDEPVLGNLVILIGRNSSGKTNLLEAIDCFFREFDPSLERSIGSPNSELWNGRLTSAPIEWNVCLKLEQFEISSVIGKDFEVIFEGVSNKEEIRVIRQIVATPQDMRWRTAELTVGGIYLIKDGKTVTQDEVTKMLAVKRLGSDKEMQEAMKQVPANLVQSILSNLSALLRAQFRYVSAARDNVQPSPSFGNRAPAINPITLNSINTLAQAIVPDVRTKWRSLRVKMETVLPNHERVDSKAGQLFLENEPFSATGGGSQSIMALIHDIETGTPIMAVEEPENHLHPELIKKMLRYFIDISKGAQARQLFVATHSPFMVDSSHIQGIVALYWDGQETKARQIGNKQELKAALYDIGARPSDIFFADLVLIVEGESDKVVFQNWARTLGVPLEDIHASVMSCRGVNKARHHLKLWIEITKEVGLPRYAIVDKSGESEINAVVEKGLIDANNAHVLERGDLEDYYPTDVLISSLSELFDVTVTEDKIPAIGREKIIDKLINKRPEEWKVPLAEGVSRTTKKHSIPKEIADFLRRIYNENSSK